MKGIMFNNDYGMWEAVMLGTKTNTRRTGKTLEPVNKNPDEWVLISNSGPPFTFHSKNGNSPIDIKPRHKTGDVLYLQEPTMNSEKFLTAERQIFYKYKDHQGNDDTAAFSHVIDELKRRGAKWGNKQFMGFLDARYFIKITDVKLERLRDISFKDCIGEGIHNRNSVGPNRIFLIYKKGEHYKQGTKYTHNAQQSYASLLGVIQEDNTAWEKNYWCFSYHFVLLTPKQMELYKQSQSTLNKIG